MNIYIIIVFLFHLFHFNSLLKNDIRKLHISFILLYNNVRVLIFKNNVYNVNINLCGN